MTAPADGDQAAADFDITSIVIDEYAECPPLEGLAEEAAEIERLLAEFGGLCREPVSAWQDAGRAGGQGPAT